ncbi:MAG: DUF4287 domain-containing protein [Flavobacteriales bacterium]|nr:DUF4287 domain-containing protein [Flavobacteriales bacterium]
MDVKDMEAKMLASLEEKTGKPIAHWVTVAKKSGLTKHMQILKYLKDEHGLRYGHANTVAFKALGTDAASAASDTELVDGMFKGKEHFRKLHDKLAKTIKAFGKDVELAPKKSYVSVRRAKQFAILQPSTKNRFDLGINLKGQPGTARLEEGAAFNGMASHRVALTNEKDVDAELLRWLKEAYKAAG